MSNEATMPQDISDREDFYKDSSNKHRKSPGNKSFCELLSLSDYQDSTATKPSGRDNKSGWYDINQKHVNLSLTIVTSSYRRLDSSWLQPLCEYLVDILQNISHSELWNWRRSHAACAVACRKCDSSKFFEICSHTLWY